MTPQRFRKKPITVEAMLYTGDNASEIRHWTGFNHYTCANGSLMIDTLEGVMRASVGDWIIRGVKGEHYPCHPDIFQQTYEAAE